MLAGCTATPPKQYTETNTEASVHPQYTNGITIPYNIAPLNFAYTMEGKAFITELQAGDQSLVIKGKQTDWKIKEWRQMLETNKGKNIKVYTYVQTDKGWERLRPITWHVAEEPIDPYISYRIIAPSYVTYEELSIRQRELATFDEQMIYNNMLLSTDKDGQCINCHSYKNYKTDNMQFHARQHKGGTLLVTTDGVKKINLKTDSTISAGVYPAWHPTHNFIAYSINDTGQSFHTKNNNKIEVQDLRSDLILYDVDHNEVGFIEHDTLEWEVFPTWAPDGKTLYYCSAHMEIQDHSQREREIIDRYREFQYNIYRKSFDPNTKAFGPSELVLDAKAMNKSATFPRISPDGRYLLFGMGEYGCFHIWHKDADLCLIDLETMQLRNLKEVNSSDVESYHAWSSNGRWMLFTSRRDDGGYTHLYIAYFDEKGKAHKPFLLPQRNPYFYNDYYKSFNVPEFMVEPVTITPQEFARYLDTDAQAVRFRSQSVEAKN
jgi:Tol biopolymer transport system component